MVGSFEYDTVDAPYATWLKRNRQRIFFRYGGKNTSRRSIDFAGSLFTVNPPIIQHFQAMITDDLANSAIYEQLHPLFPAAFARLRQLATQTDLPEGGIEIDGERIHAGVTRRNGKSAAEARVETHRRYIDIQYVVDGTDRIGWMPLSDCRGPLGYNDSKDVEFYEDRPGMWFDLSAGRFAVFFPHDAHAPMANEGRPIVKIVIKVAV